MYMIVCIYIRGGRFFLFFSTPHLQAMYNIYSIGSIFFTLDF